MLSAGIVNAFFLPLFTIYSVILYIIIFNTKNQNQNYKYKTSKYSFLLWHFSFFRKFRRTIMNTQNRISSKPKRIYKWAPLYHLYTVCTFSTKLPDWIFRTDPQISFILPVTIPVRGAVLQYLVFRTDDTVIIFVIHILSPRMPAFHGHGTLVGCGQNSASSNTFTDCKHCPSCITRHLYIIKIGKSPAFAGLFQQSEKCCRRSLAHYPISSLKTGRLL